MAYAKAEQLMDEIIKVNQVLHGYSDGHRLMQTSMKMSRDVENKMLLLSDMSGPTMQQGFEHYFTGYPLEEAQVYAFAQTWYASEMRRPGCVWTHTLLIDNADLGKIKDFRILKSLFSRPKEPLSLQKYKSAIPLLNSTSILHKQDEWSEDAAGKILSALYAAPPMPIFVPSTSTANCVDLIFAIWSQQWPKLRRSFRFCTGSLSNRSFEGNLFDLQVIPLDAVRLILRETPSVEMVDPTTSLNWGGAPLWLRVATKDLLQVGEGALRKFMWNFGADVKEGRSSFSHLANIYNLIEAVSHREASLESLIDAIAYGFPHNDEAAHLKLAILSNEMAGKENAFFSNDMKASLLRTLFTTNKYQPFKLKDKALVNYATGMWETAPEQAKDLILELFSSNLNALGESFLSEMLRLIKLDQAVEIFRRNPDVIPIIISQNPTLATIPQLWSNTFGKQTQFLDAILTSSPISEETITAIIHAMLKVDAYDMARKAIKSFGRKGVFSILDWANNMEGDQFKKLHQELQQALASQPSALVDWLNEAQNPKASTMALILSLLDPNSLEAQNLGEKNWPQLTSLSNEYLDKNALIKAMGFLLALGLKNQVSHSEELVAYSFECVHDAAADGVLEYETWTLLRTELPSLSWWGDWDKCERLRLGLIERFLEDNWRPIYFLRAVKNPETFRQLVAILKQTENGRRFLKGLSFPLSQNEIETTPSQLKILKGS